MRLDVLLRLAGYGSRREIKRLMKQGAVSVDHQTVYVEKTNVDADLQVICVNEERVAAPKKQVYYMLNKPEGVVSAVVDAQHPTVIDLIRPEDRVDGLYPIGRLDRDTQGLLLLTNNGPLGFQMLFPKHHVQKTYYVEVNGMIGENEVEAFQKGIQFLDGYVCQPAQLRIQKSSPTHSEAYVTIREGKYHQVKKMFLSVGVKVMRLVRISFGSIELDTQLEPGEYRALTEKEFDLLKRYF